MLDRQFNDVPRSEQFEDLLRSIWHCSKQRMKQDCIENLRYKPASFDVSRLLETRKQSETPRTIVQFSQTNQRRRTKPVHKQREQPSMGIGVSDLFRLRCQLSWMFF